MKRLSLLLALGALTPVCSPLVHAAPASNGAPFQWRLRLRPGQKWLTTTDTSAHMTMAMPSMPGLPKGSSAGTNSDISSHVVLEHKVLSSDARGARVQLTYKALSQRNITRQGNRVIVDSSKPSALTADANNITKKIVGARISYLLSPTGKISDVQGTEQFVNRISSGAKGRGAAMSKVMAQGLMSPQALNTWLGNSYMALPKKAVKPGATWRYGAPLSIMGMTVSQNGQSTLTSRANGIATLAQKASYNTTSDSAMKTMGMNIPMKYQGTSTGQIKVDERTGLTLEDRSSQILRTESSIKMPNQKGQGMSLRMNIRSQTLTKTRLLP